jgi:hypothetical protein
MCRLRRPTPLIFSPTFHANPRGFMTDISAPHAKRRSSYLLAAVGMGMLCLTQAALAQTASPVSKLDGHRCPVNYTSRGNMCMPDKDAMPANLKGKSNCPVGTHSDGEYCVQSGRKKAGDNASTGSKSSSSGSASGSNQLGAGTPEADRFGTAVVASFAKKNLADFCPSTYETHQEYCIATVGPAVRPLPAPAAVRFKEGGACNAGETEEFGLYCVGPLSAEWTYDRASPLAMRSYNTQYFVLNVNKDIAGVQSMQKTGPVTPASLVALKAKEDAAKGVAAAPAPSAPTAAAPTPPEAPATPATKPNEAAVKALGGLLNGLMKR